MTLLLLKTQWTCVGNHWQTYQVSPRSVRWSLAVRPSAPRRSSPSRLRSNCDPNVEENTHSPFTNPQLSAECRCEKQEESEGTRVYLCVTVREERREVFTHVSLLPVVPHSLLSVAGSNTERLPLWDVNEQRYLTMAKKQKNTLD